MGDKGYENEYLSIKIKQTNTLNIYKQYTLYTRFYVAKERKNQNQLINTRIITDKIKVIHMRNN